MSISFVRAGTYLEYSSLLSISALQAGNLPTTTPALPVQVRHVRNARNATLLEWPAPDPPPVGTQQEPGTHSPSDPAGGTANTAPNLLLDPEARRNVHPDLLPTPYNMNYSGNQPFYPVQLPSTNDPSFLPQSPPLLPIQPLSAPDLSSDVVRASYMSPQAHPLVSGEALTNAGSPPVQSAVNHRVLMLVNDDASRSTSPSQATDSSTLRGPRSQGSFSTVGEPVPQYEPIDSTVLTDEPEQVAEPMRLGRQGTMLPPYSQHNPFRRSRPAAGLAQ